MNDDDHALEYEEALPNLVALATLLRKMRTPDYRLMRQEEANIDILRALELLLKITRALYRENLDLYGRADDDDAS